ncbi:mannitol dehydrogenase family protein [Auraticoccus sp. F435]|uniref:Mannitol dehydrogenase family protein n=1 Tax=Auraticoccus cholistanensis TaxID=2656650 RepID=A0A6A9V250_9ACTN|nr:mannitol dehydrogenase family protein [Auraticoccus cholistanensis]
MTTTIPTSGVAGGDDHPGLPARTVPVPTVPVCADRLAGLDDGRVSVPCYDRAALVPAVVHIGVGCFHRAHQELYFDDLARRGETAWGVTGVGLHSPEMGEVLTQQDNLYTVLVRDETEDRVRVVGALTRYLFAPEDPAEVLRTLADERTRLVTLTITGSAYPSQEVDPADPAVRADVETPDTPGTAFGYLVQALDLRRRAGLPAFTVLSCDNIQGNGAVTRAAVVSTARLRDPELADWIERHAAFPSSMVDRITPETTATTRELLAEEYHVEDRWPVVTEPFSQWIIEDSFSAGRPPLDAVGARFVDDVLPYEVMKARLLNGAHSALGCLGALAGYTTSHEAMADPVVRQFVAGYLREASAVLPMTVPGIDLDAYCQTLLRRFANPRVGDQLSRLCRRGSTKLPSYVFPTLQQALEQDRPRAHVVLAVAAWLRYLHGVDHSGSRYEVSDVRAEELRELVLAGGCDPRPVLQGAPDLFAALADDPRLADELSLALTALQAGPHAAAAALSAAGKTPTSGGAPQPARQQPPTRARRRPDPTVQAPASRPREVGTALTRRGRR